MARMYRGNSGSSKDGWSGGEGQLEIEPRPGPRVCGSRRTKWVKAGLRRGKTSVGNESSHPTSDVLES